MSDFDLGAQMREKLEQAWEHRTKGNELPPSWFIYAPDNYADPLVLVTPWSNNASKCLAVRTVAAFVRDARPHPAAFLFVTDAWYRTITEGEVLDRPVSEYYDACELIQVVGYTATEGMFLHRPYRHRDDGTLEVTGPDWSEDQELGGGMTDQVVAALRGVTCS